MIAAADADAAAVVVVVDAEEEDEDEVVVVVVVGSVELWKWIESWRELSKSVGLEQAEDE